VPRNRGVSIAGPETILGRITRERDEARQQQTATANILRVISQSPTDVGALIDSIVLTAARSLRSDLVIVFLCDGRSFSPVAGASPETLLTDLGPLDLPIDQSVNFPSRAILAKKMLYLPDWSRIELPEHELKIHKLLGVNSSLYLPLLRDKECIGLLNLIGKKPNFFGAVEIAQAEFFRDQALIAMNNARLLNELRQRTDDLSQRSTDLSEALEQQTATSEVLQVISSSQGDLEPVFAAMLGSATRICEAKFGNLFLREGEAFRAVAWHGEPTYVNTWQGPALIIKADMAELPLARVAATKQRVHVEDLRQEAAYKAGHEQLAALVDKGGARTLLIVPMLNEQTLVGAIALYRQVVRPFAAKQIALVESFAAQAVIAIENARLLRERREKTEDVVKLNQHLEQRVADQVGEIERMGRLRRFLPPQVADLIVASGAEKQLESHRREITALFCDLRGFTGFSEASAPEDVMALLRDYHAAIGELIIKYSGTLERYAGDGVMVVFNDPVPVDNPALRAVQMALETREAMGALMEKWRELGHDVGFGIGIAHGFATLGTIGFEGRFDYAAIGTVSNVASRLCDEAKPGQILISPRVFTAVKDAITVESVGEFALKGIGRPLAAYNVLSAIA
jgi:class 3 adenylate cyclase